MVVSMTARDLLDQLLNIQKERDEFDELDVYVDIITEETYDQEQTAIVGEEYTEIGGSDGVVFGLIVATGSDLNISPPKETGDYIVIRAVEEEVIAGMGGIGYQP